MDLVKAMGTRYIIDALEPELLRVLSKHDASEVIDLAGARLGPRASAKLYDLQLNGYTLIDSKNNQMNSLIKSSYDIMKARDNFKDNQIAIIPEFVDSKSLKGYVQATGMSDVDMTYKVSDYPSKSTICVVLMLMLKYPKVVIDLSNGTKEVFEFFREYWIDRFVENKHIAYIEYYKAGVLVRPVEDGKVFVNGVGYLNEKRYVLNYNCIPFEVGNTVLLDDDEYVDVLRAIMNYVNSLDTVKTKKEDKSRNKLTDFLGG